MINCSRHDLAGHITTSQQTNSAHIAPYMAGVKFHLCSFLLHTIIGTISLAYQYDSG